jgi:hypothetical protein
MSNAHNPQHWSQLDMDEQIVSGRGWRTAMWHLFWFPRRRNLPVAGAASTPQNPNVKTRHDIETRVRQQLTREYATGRLGDKEALKREVERRAGAHAAVAGNNYTRLATPI